MSLRSGTIDYWRGYLGKEKLDCFPLKGGINSDVRLCTCESFKFVLKIYRGCKSVKEMRFRAESEFLRYANKITPGSVPGLIHADSGSLSIGLEYVPGVSFMNSIVSMSELKGAQQFIERLNSDRILADRLISSFASDASSTIDGHISGLRDRLGNILLPAKTYDLYPRIASLRNRIRVAVEALAEETAKVSYHASDSQFDEFFRCVSPSDFGFHNALRTGQGTVFFDFEHAGWDDIAKLCVDFYLQPRCRTYSLLVPDALWGNKLDRRLLENRANILYRVQCIRWALISLRPFMQDKISALHVTSDGAADDTLARVYQADRFLGLVGTPPLGLQIQC
jgi:hypothetical protein